MLNARAVEAFLADKGFKGLLEEAVNQAIRKQPDDAVAFLSTHFQKMLKNKSKKKMQALSQDARCMMDHSAKLDIYSDPAVMRATGIICTIGPKTKTPEALTQLRQCGMNIVRMNFSHGSYEYHGSVVAAARQSVAEEPLDGRLVAIALDTKGPEIRTGMTVGDAVIELVKGDTITVSTDPALKESTSKEVIYCDYKNLPSVMKVGGVMFIDDGLIELQVRSIDEKAGTMTCLIMNTGMLGSKKGCNLPEVDVDLPALSEKDKADLTWGVSQNIDMVFASFIRKASDVLEVRACLEAADPVVGKRIRIISKIENHEGMRNFDEILEVTDGVMVARGDLGIEIPTSKVFLAQKMMIAKCNMMGKPVICATQMLESMTFNPRPTRAEASDVANAVLDGADCVMLSGETAKGAYPKEAVTVMASVCREAEAAIFYKQVASDIDKAQSEKNPLDINEAVANACVNAATYHEASLIITLTTTGTSARLISKYRPRCPILVICRDPNVGASCNLHRGCIPYHYPKAKPEDGSEDITARFIFAMDVALKAKLVKLGDNVALAYAWAAGVSSLTNFRIVKVGETINIDGIPGQPYITPPSLLSLLDTEVPAKEMTKLIAGPSSTKAKPGGMQKDSQDASFFMDHCAKLDIYSDPAATRTTGIICTIGPKTQAVDKMTQLRQCGMNIVRMNFSHGSYEYHGSVVAAARQSVAEEPLDGRLVAIALDTKGPEIRTGMTVGDAVIELVKGDTITVSTDPALKESTSKEVIYCDYKNLPSVMKVGGVMFIDDGLIELQVRSIDEKAGTMTCLIMNTGMLGSKKGCNLPEVDVDLPALSEKDKADLTWGVSQNIDMVFASFIRKASDVLEVRACLEAADPVVGKRIRIISKIENHEGMRNFDEILEVTDGVMVARGDLGIEIPTSKVFLAQKMMIAKCNMMGKPVICATQMLESMTFNPRPTRAEASDVANAVLDGADCVMLSGETAKGAYPKEAVTVMASVCREAEAAIFYSSIVSDMEAVMPLPLEPSDSVAKAVVEAATCSGAVLIVTLTVGGTSARLISKHRPRCPILVLASDPNVGAACNLHRGCIPFAVPEGVPIHGHEDERFAAAITIAKQAKLAKSGDKIVLAHGVRHGVLSLSNFKLVKLA